MDTLHPTRMRILTALLGQLMQVHAIVVAIL